MELAAELAIKYLALSRITRTLHAITTGQLSHLGDSIGEILLGRKKEMTYVISNIICADAQTPGTKTSAFRHVKTALVLRRLRALEKAGRVECVPSIYARQLCWAAKR